MVTFLFTDIEASTRLLALLGENYVPMLRRHNDMIRAAVALHGGVEVDTAGDSFLIAFADAAAGVRCAADAQRSLMETEWPAATPLRVRMGLHAGHCEPVDGGYVALPVHQAARIVAAAHGGQVLASEDVVRLLPGRSLDDVTTIQLGAFRVRDFDEPPVLHMLCAEGLPTTFPALRVSPAAAHNIPPSRTSLIGRDPDVVDVVGRMRTTRLLTLVGPGGVGKTRLAQHAGCSLADIYSHGAWLVELGTVRNGGEILDVTAAALGVRDTTANDAFAELVNSLRQRECLVILDNCEHVLDAASRLVAGVLDSCPDVRFLATSREPLGLDGEIVRRLDPLAQPEPNEGLDGIARSPAVRLFLDRAAAASGAEATSARELGAVARLVRKLDGLPLAIELAAASASVLPPSAIERLMDDRAITLKSRRRDVPGRQRDLHELVAWSHDLLDDDERVVFRRLAVFAGGGTLAATNAVCGPLLSNGTSAADVVLRLADRSLVVVSEEGSWSLLETVREYAIGRLRECGETMAYRERHADWVCGLVTDAAIGLRGPDQREWLDRLERDRANVRSSIDFLLLNGDGRALECAADFAPIWWIRGPVHEGRAVLTRALRGAGENEATVKALGELARLLFADCQHAEECRRLAQRSVDLARQLGVEHLCAPAARVLGQLAEMRGDVAETDRIELRIVQVARTRGDASNVVIGLVNVSQHHLDRGDRDSARELVREATVWAERSGSPRLHAAVSMAAGAVYYEERLFDDAVAAFRHALGATRDIRDPRQEAFILMKLAGAEMRAGDVDNARLDLDESLRIARQCDDVRKVAETLWTLADLSVRVNRPEAALQWARQALTIGADIRDASELAWDIEMVGHALAHLGDVVPAAILLGGADELRRCAGLSPSMTDRDGFEPALALIRAHLAERTEALLRVGAKMPLASLIDGALGRGRMLSDAPTSDSASRSNSNV